MEKFVFDDQAGFLNKLRALIDAGVDAKKINIFMPYHVHGVEELLNRPQSGVRFFALFGALTGIILGFAFTIFTAHHYPIMTSGKPLVSIPPFIIIAFATTILIGSLITFGGFLILSALPSPKNIISPEEYGNQFVIIVN